MGPSGSGKTTLLNALAHRQLSFRGHFTGSIAVNGAAVSSSISVFQSISSYVEQEDALIGSLTVRETLDFAARLSLPKYVREKRLFNSIQSNPIFNSAFFFDFFPSAIVQYQPRNAAVGSMNYCHHLGYRNRPTAWSGPLFAKGSVEVRNAV